MVTQTTRTGREALAKRHRCGHSWVWAALLLLGVGLAPAARALDVQFAGQDRVLDPNYYSTGVGQRAPMLPPGDVALIDDWYHNSTIVYSDAVQGDAFGVRATNPNGVVSSTIVTHAGSCFRIGSTSYCPANSAGLWWLGLGIRFQPVGQWRVDVMKNGGVTNTFYFQLRPYTLDVHGGLNQAVAVRSLAPLPLAVRLTLPDGTPAGAGKDVSFVLSSRPGGANPAGGFTSSSSYTGAGSSSITVQTDASGIARTNFETGSRAGSYVVSVTAPTAPGVTRTFTVTASGSNPLDAAIPEKNLGDDPSNNSSCATATQGFTENPINVATGNKVGKEVDYDGAGVFPLRLVRHFNSLGTRAGSFGAKWRGHYDRSLVITTTTVRNRTTSVAEAVRADGRVLRFAQSGGSWTAEPDIVDRLQSIAGGYRYTCGDDQVETYSSAGKLTAVTTREGLSQTLSYDAQGRLAQISDGFGRTLVLQYDASNRVAQMTDPAGRTYTYVYSVAGDLVSVRYPDLAQRQYHYENAAWPRALTGITDENGSRFATYEYDSSGRALRSMHAGGAMQRTVYYYANGMRDVLDALGNPRRYGFAVIQGVDRRTSLDNAACASCGNAVMTTGYSSSGYVASLTDYRGTQTSFVRDGRGLETSRTEAVGQPEARTTTTTWHATFRLPLTVTRPGQRTTFGYDASGRMTGRSVIDTATNATRSWTYAYNAQGLLANIDGPRTDVADVTQFSYDAQGNLATKTNALGQTTRYTSYDAHGRLLSMTDPNGLVTNLVYDLRGRLISRNVGGRLTRYDHDQVGQLIRVTQPDGSWLDHSYDAAHRLVGQADSGGHRAVYTLDGDGRRIRQEHFDASGNSTYLRRFAYDPMGRALQEIDSLDRVQRRFGYDTNGNRVSETDALGASAALTYDRHNRLTHYRDALGATTTFAHDARNNLIRVSDPVAATTVYTYDGLDNRVQETSPDAGSHSFGFDAAGNLRSRSWPNGRAVSISYDALDRLLGEDYGAGVQVNYQYDIGANGLGRLTSMSDPAGSTGWTYDVWGRVLQKSRSIGARVLNTGYAYDSAGRLSALTYPSGRVVGHDYDAGGRIASLSLDGAPLVSDIDWLPAPQSGPPRSWTQGNGRWVTKTYDRDGQLLTQSFEGGLRTLAYDAKGRVTQAADGGGTRSYGYDNADRVTAEAAGAQAWSYTYDGNGNRLSENTPSGATAYAYGAGSNRLHSASGVQARNFAHDAAGNLTNEGATTYAYDARNRMLQAPGVAFAYDGQGLRVYKATITTPRYYAHDLDRKLLGEYEGSSNVAYETVWLGDLPIAVLKGGQRYWIDADQIGAPRTVRNQADQIVWRWGGEAFGSTPADDNPSGLGGFEFNMRFPGQVYDRETGLNYNDQRDYSPGMGRYVQSDPIGLAGGPNRYLYVAADPLTHADPFGLDETVWRPGPGRSVVDGPRNGNWGGGSWSGGRPGTRTSPRGIPPTDSADACYRRHDICYDSGANRPDCDVELVSELRNLHANPRVWPMPPRPGTEADTVQFMNWAIWYFRP